jgi:hypothetical protein
MIPDLLDRSTAPLSNATEPPKDTVALDATVPVDPRQVARTTIDDQGPYEAAVSEGWPVSPFRRPERGTVPP